MAIAPFAIWKPLPAGVNHSSGGMVAYDGVILHIMEGILDGTDSWFRNPQAQASAHFGAGRDGRLYQWVDTADKAWAQSEGNPRNISIENEGMAGDSLTTAQMERVAEILAWANKVHGVPINLNDSPTGKGLGWHGMGGTAWGGHYACPGDPIKAQRQWILTRARTLISQSQVHIQSVSPAGSVAPAQLLSPAIEEELMPMLKATDPKNGCHALCDRDTGAVYCYNKDGSPGGHFLGGANRAAWGVGTGQPNGPVVAFEFFDDGNPALSAYVVWTQGADGTPHSYSFPSSGVLAK